MLDGLVMRMMGNAPILLATSIRRAADTVRGRRTSGRGSSAIVAYLLSRHGLLDERLPLVDEGLGPFGERRVVGLPAQLVHFDADLCLLNRYKLIQAGSKTHHIAKK